MRKTESGIPLSELSGHYDDSLSWQVNLPPFVPLESMILDTDRLEKFTHLAGLKHVSISSKAGEITSYHVAVNQISSGGVPTAMANAGQLVHKAVLSRSDIVKDDEYNHFSDFIWNDGVIQVNSSELNDRALRIVAKDDTIKSPYLWATLLNEAIADGIYQSAKENLLGRNVSRFNRTAFYVTIGELATESLVNEAVSRNLGSAMLYGAGVIAINQGAVTALGRINGNYLRDRRWSLIPGYQADRVLLAKVIPRLLPVIKVIK